MQDVIETGTITVRDRALTEFFKWLPALAFFAAFVVTKNMLCLSYALAFALWPSVKSAKREPRKPAAGQEEKPQLRLRPAGRTVARRPLH